MNFLGGNDEGWPEDDFEALIPKVFKIVYTERVFQKEKNMFLPIVGQVSSITWLATWITDKELNSKIRSSLFPPNPEQSSQNHMMCDLGGWLLQHFSGDSSAQNSPLSAPQKTPKQLGLAMALSQAFTVVRPGSVVAPTLNEIPTRVVGTNSHGKSGTGAAISLQDIFEILSIPDRCFWGEVLGVWGAC